MMRAAGVILAALLAGVVVFASGLATTSTHGQAQYASRAGQSAALFMQMMPDRKSVV